MANEIVPAQSIQTNIPGVELIYLEDQDLAGINQGGFARLLGCDSKTAANAFHGVKNGGVLELEMQTDGGIQGVKFATEDGVIEALEIVMAGRYKAETKIAARDVYRRFARAGFKLGVMLNVAPEALKAKVDAHAEEMAVLQLRKEVLTLEKALLDKRDWIVQTMPEAIQQKVLGYAEIKTVEYRDRVIHNEDLINDGSTVLKASLCHRYGFLTKAGKPDYKTLNDKLAKLPTEAFSLTVRLQDNQELRRDWLPQLDQVVKESDRNLYLGE